MRFALLAAVLSLAAVACGRSPQIPHANRATAAARSNPTNAQDTVESPRKPPLSHDAGKKAAVPIEVTAIVERAQLCVHFAGEFNGDRSEQDAATNRTMDSLSCGTVKQEVAAMQVHYPGLTALQPAVDAVDGL